MKRTVMVLFAFCVLFYSCSNESGINEPNVDKGVMRISFQVGLKKITNTSEVRYAVVTVENNEGNNVYNQEKVEMFNMNGEFISTPLSFDVGNSYSLSEYFLLDENYNVIYITPKEGSEMSALVTNPLSITFNIQKDETTKLVPEVIEAQGSASDFGYSTFGFNFIETMDIFIQSFVYDNLETNIIPAVADLAILNNDDTLYLGSVSDTLRNIKIKADFDSCSVKISKSGYKNYIKYFQKTEMEEYKTKPLIVVLEPSVTRNGLVAEWLFTGNADDGSGNNLNGTVSGPVLTNDRFGNANGAYEFDGVDDYIKVLDNDLLESENIKTISFWFYTNASSVSHNQFIISKLKTSPLNGYHCYIADGQKHMNIAYCYDSETDYVQTGQEVTQYGTWVNYTFVTRADGYIYCYKNGSYYKTSSKALPANLPGNEMDIVFGARTTLIGNEYFNGKIDDIRIYNRALTEEEVEEIYSEVR